MRGPGKDAKAGGDGRQRGNTRKRSLTLRLNPDERELVRLACKHYRNTIPSYLAGRQEECRILDALVSRLE